MAAARRSEPIPADIDRQQFDVIIVGAGINGAGIARDAAMRGLNVLLLEQGDFAAGTTAWSTRLIHGGLRYLEYYEIPLVRESLREREILLRVAPHLVKPLAFLIPLYTRSKRGPRIIQLGMIAYDLLSYDKSVPNHQMLNREETLRRAPGINPEGLEAAALYYDAQVTYPERLTLENALSARDHGATVLTHARVDEVLMEGQRAVGVRFTDVLDGPQYTVRAPVIVNVAGPWVDAVLDKVPHQQMIGGTKGSHIVVDPFPGAPKDALYIEAETDLRPYFIVPWNGRYLIGTTDIRHTGDPGGVATSDEEIDYLVRETNRVIPNAGLTRDKVHYSYAGVRPLPYQEKGTPGSITRRHIVFDHAPQINGLISIVGGKITTYRNLAEQTVDLVFKKLSRKSPPCVTARVPLPGGNTANWAQFVASFKDTSGLDEQTADRLLHIYGVFAPELLRIAEADPNLLATVSPQTGAIGAEVVYGVRWELAQTLTDLLMRRCMVGLDAATGLDAVAPAAQIAQRHLGWTRERTEQEITEYRHYIERFKPHRLSAPTAENV